MREFGGPKVYTQGIEQGIDPRFKRIRDIARREYEDHLKSKSRPPGRTMKWNDAIYSFAQDHLDKQLSREELKKLFRQRILEIEEDEIETGM
jgi:hypothetical protein